MISGFRCEVDENCALLGHYATISGKFYVLVTVRLGIILKNNQLDEQIPFKYIYFDSLHVSSNLVLIIRRVSFINTVSGLCQSV